MKKSIYKYGFSGLLFLVSLSGCCLNPYGSKQSSKNSRDINQESVTLHSSENKTPRSRRLFSRRSQKKSTSQVQMNFKKYEDQVTEQDKKDISFVVAAAAEKSSISLAMSQAELKTALHRIKELHPLALLKFVAENSSLIEGMKKMQSRDWIWNMFLNELKEVFSQAVAQGIISDEDINDFASSLHLDKEIVSSVVQGEKWPELLDMVMQIS
ncbi:hypothetical protein [Chlamydia gallinacea]|uniref:Lipoprotein n=2 Tax=Chlamydia gallinacea TaxID=1457153 RepID=A0A173DYE7_9CHLA|nr:hypothetical protein [Chlamydia gallinacea]ANG65955.1 hypothetical protein M787_001285 [Chlamydia gallinacea 08-1274/3]AQT77809.1 hypothetical protein B1F83_04340 [Chlamydia gallinacea]MBX6680134.1 hypothetical protein [Chlamydia gallinacea]MBX6687366.1 hypothetical protein [Chlamydia gallinacea]